MPIERSGGIIFYRNTKTGRKYLVIRSSRDVPTRPEFWDFPKGLLEKKETGIEAAQRESREEVGLNKFEINPKFKATIKYFTKRINGFKYVALFLAEAKTGRVKLSWEHDAYEWLSYQEAYDRMSLKPMKEALTKAEKFLTKK